MPDTSPIGERDATGERSVALAKIGVVVQHTSCGS